MRKGFTIIEMLIVVTVLVTLMAIVFKIGNIGSESEKRIKTVMRMQKLENCLSGYHAAFGSYPPVKLHGTRDFYQEVDGHGIQGNNRNESLWGWTKIGETAEIEAWLQVQAACKSQPVGSRFPYPEGYSEYIRLVSDEMKRRAASDEEAYESYHTEPIRSKLLAGFDDGGSGSGSTGRFDKNKDKVDWRNLQLFRFGLMSYLLPRYLTMMNGDSDFFTEYAQWTGNNVLPCDPFTGNTYNNWSQVRMNATSTTQNQLVRVANIPSQAICARWMPNLASSCQGNHSTVLFGIEIWDGTGGELDVNNPNIELFTPDTSHNGSDSYRDQYVLDCITIADGWGNEFYYYSPAPYQTYTLWSSGPNGRTFPTWVSRKKLSAKANECVTKWTFDDIFSLSN